MLDDLTQMIMVIKTRWILFWNNKKSIWKSLYSPINTGFSQSPNVWVISKAERHSKYKTRSKLEDSLPTNLRCLYNTPFTQGMFPKDFFFFFFLHGTNRKQNLERSILHYKKTKEIHYVKITVVFFFLKLIYKWLLKKKKTTN